MYFQWCRTEGARGESTDSPYSVGKKLFLIKKADEKLFVDPNYSIKNRHFTGVHCKFLIELFGQNSKFLINYLYNKSPPSY